MPGFESLWGDDASENLSNDLLDLTDTFSNFVQVELKPLLPVVI